MRIAIPTTDRETLFNRTGRAKEFIIYDIINGSIDFLEFRENPHKHHEHVDGEEHKDHSHKDLVDLLKDCDAILVHMVGQHFKSDFDDADIPIYKTKETGLLSVIRTFSNDMLRHKRI